MKYVNLTSAMPFFLLFFYFYTIESTHFYFQHDCSTKIKIIEPVSLPVSLIYTVTGIKTLGKC